MSVVILSAVSGMYKTTACRHVVRLATAAGFRVAGLLSVPMYRGRRKGRHRAPRSPRARLADPGTSPWTESRAAGGHLGIRAEGALAWGQQVLASLPACDLLVIDEIGRLEMEQGLGSTNALDVLRRPDYRLALVSLRPSLVEALARRLEGMRMSVQALDKMN
jgi:nucleoside-triphosphatase THEP1